MKGSINKAALGGIGVVALALACAACSGGVASPSSATGDDAGIPVGSGTDAGSSGTVISSLCDSSCPTQIDQGVCWHGACLQTHPVLIAGGGDVSFHRGKGVRVSDAGVLYTRWGNRPIRYDPVRGTFMDSYGPVQSGQDLMNVAPGANDHAYATAETMDHTASYLYEFPPDGGQPMVIMTQTPGQPKIVDVAEGGYVCPWCFEEMGSSSAAADQFFVQNGTLYWFDIASNGSFIWAKSLDGRVQATTTDFKSYAIRGMARNETSVFVLINAGPDFSALAFTSSDLSAQARVYNLPPLSPQGIGIDKDYVYFGIPRPGAKDDRVILAAMRLADGRVEALGFLSPSASPGMSAPPLYQISLTPHYIYVLDTTGTWWARLPN